MDLFILSLIIILIASFIIIYVRRQKENEENEEIYGIDEPIYCRPGCLNIEINGINYDYYVFNIVGTFYCGWEEQLLAEELQTNDIISLDKEPENPQDANAIRVCVKNRRIGYVNWESAQYLTPIFHKIVTVSITEPLPSLEEDEYRPTGYFSNFQAAAILIK